MALSSMTGFATASGALGTISWQWELKSVNGKTLEIRFRLPSGFDGLEAGLRQLLSQSLRRGTIQVALVLVDSAARTELQINEMALEQLLASAERWREKAGAAPLQIEALLSLPGMVRLAETVLSPEEKEALTIKLMASFEEALTGLLTARYQEGDRLAQLIAEQLDRCEAMVSEARDNPARAVLNIKARLKEQVARLLEATDKLEAERLHQEAVLLATRADIQEEIDRLFSHIFSARELLMLDEPVGRKFDFLAQEFNREANTLCSKAIDGTITRTGLELKTTIDQMREQVQNIE